MVLNPGGIVLKTKPIFVAIELQKQKLEELKDKVEAEEMKAQEESERRNNAMKARSSSVLSKREQKLLHKDSIKKVSKKTVS